MINKSSIVNTYFRFLIVISFLGIGIMGAISIKKQYNDFQKESGELKKNYIEAQKIIVKHEVERALEYIEMRKATATIPEDELKKEILEWFSKIRFQNRGNDLGILFVRSYEGILLMSVSTTEMVGENIAAMLDPDSINTHELFMETLKNPNGGYAQYSWYNPFQQRIGNKTSFVKASPDWQWFVGAGFWEEDLNILLDQKKLELRKNYRNYLALVLATMLTLLLIIYLGIKYLSRKMKANLSVLSDFLISASKKYLKLDVSKIEYSEFAGIGILLDKMMKSRHQAEERFKNLFENAPISLWEEDFSDLMIYLEEQLEIYKTKPEILFEEHPEVLAKCAELVKVIDVNQHTLVLYEAESKEDLLGNLKQTLTKKSLGAFKKNVLAYYYKDTSKIIEGRNKSLKGKDIDVLMRWSYLTGPQDSKHRVIVSFFNTSEIHTVEKKLIASEMRFRAIFENNHSIMLLINPKDGKIIDANPAAVKFYGYNQNTFINDLFMSDINANEQKIINNTIEEVLNTKSIFLLTKNKLSNGEIRDVEVNSGVIMIDNEETIFSIIYDVTEKQKAKFELEQSKNKLESIFRAAPTGIGVVSERIITEVNQRFCDIMGYKEEELIGKESIFLYPSKEEFEWVGKEKYDQIKEKGTGTVETKLKHKDGHTIDVLLSSTPMDLDDLTIGVSFTALDITQRKKDVAELENHRNHLEEIVKNRTTELEDSQGALLNLVDDLNKQSEKLEDANNRLIDINQELETFTYSVSHDLKAPLRGIDGYSQLLLDSYLSELNPEAQDFLRNIRKSTAQMNLLIEDLLSYSRMEQQDFEKNEVDLKALIDNLIHYYSNSLKANKIKVKISLPELIKPVADTNGLNLVLRNLIDNAIKFSSQDKKAQIEIGASENKSSWHIFVKDNGIGFDMKYHDRIYKIFQRLQLAEDFEGTGIGLAMVSKAMTRMNGRVWAESAPNEGSSFYLEISKPK